MLSWNRVNDSGNSRKRATMEKRIEVDLFGEIDVVIARLQALVGEHPSKGELQEGAEIISVRLEQVWDSYEDCHEDFVIERMETDDEWKTRRLEIQKRERYLEALAAKKEADRRKADALENELNALKKRLSRDG